MMSKRDVLRQVAEELNQLKTETERNHRMFLTRITNLQRIVTKLAGDNVGGRSTPPQAPQRMASPLVPQSASPSVPARDPAVEAAAREAARRERLQKEMLRREKEEEERGRRPSAQGRGRHRHTTRTLRKS